MDSLPQSRQALKIILKCFKKSFEITVGDETKFIGLQIERNRMDKILFIYQSNYVQHIIDRFKMGDAKPVSVLADPHAILYAAKSDEEVITNVPCREAVGSLMFLAVVSRPDIAFAVNLVSKYLNSHIAAYWKKLLQ